MARVIDVDTAALMSTLVVTVEPHTPFDDVEILLLEYGFAAFPVVGPATGWWEWSETRTSGVRRGRTVDPVTTPGDRTPRRT